ncbi:MAG: DUF2726 domain-containing protein [Pseudohongiellaceae bacterium]
MELDFWIIVLALAGLLVVIATYLSPSTAVSAYRLNPSLLSPAERSFFGVLSQAAGDSVLIFAKVRVADVIKPQSRQNKSNWQRAFNKISSKHFDFVLCHRNDLSIYCVVELNDKSHRAQSRKTRDRFLAGACESAGLQLLQVEAKKSYRISELRELLCLPSNKHRNASR